MTNKEILDIAMQQSAYYTNAKASDFLMDTNVFVKSEIGSLARKYYKEPMWKLCRIGKRLSFSLIPCCGVRKMKRKQ